MVKLRLFCGERPFFPSNFLIARGCNKLLSRMPPVTTAAAAAAVAAVVAAATIRTCWAEWTT